MCEIHPRPPWGQSSSWLWWESGKHLLNVWNVSSTHTRDVDARNLPNHSQAKCVVWSKLFLAVCCCSGGDMIITTYNNASLIVEVSPAKPMVKTCSRSLQCARYPISDRTSWTIFLTRILCCSACSMPMWRCELVTYRKQWNLVASDI